MGAGQSKNRNGQYPMPQPMPQQMYPSVYGPPPPFGPYGYGQPMYPTGVIPQGPQYPQNYPPHPSMNYPPRKKSRRPQSERFVGGFPSSSMPQPERSRRRRSESQARTSMPQPTSDNPVGRRAPTPFIPSYGRDVDPEEDEDEDDEPPSSARFDNRSSSRRTTMRYPSPPPVVPDLSRVIEPLEPASSAAFGPGTRSQAPLRNPLPPPPRDLYETSPYKSVLTLPQTTALLTATYPRQEPLTAGSLTLDPASKPKRSGFGGILRTFSRKDKQKAPAQKVLFVPVQVPSPINVSGIQQQQQQQQPGSATVLMPNSATSFNSMNAMPNSATTFNSMNPMPNSATTFNSMNPMPSSTTPTTPVPPIPSSPPAIRFDQTGKYAMFMNHSPHRVVWNNNTYPTALHLHEALKFMESRPDVAEKIRACERPEDVYPLSAAFQQSQRPDWGTVFLGFMKEVMYQKFRQHPDLRTSLLSTGTARLIYADAEDPYWGAGQNGMGQNQLGKTLAEVRDRLMSESIPV